MILCECECDGATVVEAKPKCSDLQEEDALTSVSCSDDGMVDYDGNGVDCASTCGEVCDPST